MRRLFVLCLSLCIAVPVFAQTKDYSRLSDKELRDEYERLHYHVENSGREQFAVVKALADRGNAWGLYILSSAYLSGDSTFGVSQNYSTALSYLDKGARLGYDSFKEEAQDIRSYLKYIKGESCTPQENYAVSLLFDTYIFGKPNYEEAVTAREKAFQAGYSKAKEGHHDFLLYKCGNPLCPTYVAEFCAQRMYELYGDQSGYEYVGSHYFEDAQKTNSDWAVPLYEKAIKYGHAEAALYLGDYYERHGDPEKALALYETSMKLGYGYIDLSGVKRSINQRKEEQMRAYQRQNEAEYTRAQNQSSNLAAYIVGGAIIAGVIALLNSNNYGSSSKSSSSSSYSSSSSSSSSSSYSSSSSSSSNNQFREGQYVKCMIWRDGTCGYKGRVAGVNGDKVTVYIDDVILKGILSFWIPASQETGWKELRYFHGYDYDLKREYYGRGDTIVVPSWCLSLR